jgi:hypothetical protein
MNRFDDATTALVCACVVFSAAFGCGSDTIYADPPAEEVREIPEAELEDNPDGTVDIDGFARLGTPQKVPFRVEGIFEASRDATALAGQTAMALLATDGESAPFWTGELVSVSRWKPGDEHAPWIAGDAFVRFDRDQTRRIPAAAYVRLIEGANFAWYRDSGDQVLVRWSDLSVVRRFENVRSSMANERYFAAIWSDEIVFRDLVSEAETTARLPARQGSQRDYFWHSADQLLVQDHDGFVPTVTYRLHARSGDVVEVDIPGLLDNMGAGSKAIKYTQTVRTAASVTHTYQSGNLTDVGDCQRTLRYGGGEFAFLSCADASRRITVSTGEISESIPGSATKVWGDRAITVANPGSVWERGLRRVVATYRLIDGVEVSDPFDVEHAASPFWMEWSNGFIAAGPDDVAVVDFERGEVQQYDYLCFAGFFDDTDTLAYVTTDENGAVMVWRELYGPAVRVRIRTPQECNVVADTDTAVSLGQDGRVRRYRRDGGVALVAEASDRIMGVTRLVRDDSDINPGWWHDIVDVKRTENELRLYDLGREELVVFDSPEPTALRSVGLAIGFLAESPQGLVFGFEDTPPAAMRVVSTDETAQIMGRWSPWLVTYDEDSGTSTVRRIWRAEESP